jgi:predicted Zn-ribbon and HTH transcriptional regulator
MGKATGKELMETYNYGGKVQTLRQIGIDYFIVYEYTCEKCGHSWRLSSIHSNVQCPKCRSMKLYYVSKRSCDDEVEDIIIPEDSQLL